MRTKTTQAATARLLLGMIGDELQATRRSLAEAQTRWQKHSWRLVPSTRDGGEVASRAALATANLAACVQLFAELEQALTEVRAGIPADPQSNIEAAKGAS